MPVSDAIVAVTAGPTTNDNKKQEVDSLLIGIRPLPSSVATASAQRLLQLRSVVELDLLTKYRFVCISCAADASYSAAGGSPLKLGQDHWQQLVERRVKRTELLLVQWRDAMLNE